MTGSAIVNDNTTYNAPKNAMLSSKKNIFAGTAVIIGTLVESVLAFIFLFYPFYIKTVYRSAKALTAGGNPAKVVFFKNIFISEAEVSSAPYIEIGLSSTILQIALLYLIFAVLPIVMAVIHMKGASFTNSYFVINYISKITISLIPFIIPYANLVDKSFKNRFLYLKIASAVVLAIAFIGLIYFYIQKYKAELSSSVLTISEKSAIKSRIKIGIFLFAGSVGFLVLHRITRFFVTKETTSFFLGWDNTAVTQGWVYVLAFVVMLVSVLSYISGKEFGVFPIATIALGFLISDIVAFLARVKVKGFGPNAIIILVQAVVSLLIAVFCIIIINKLKPQPYEKTRDNSIANLSINISSITFILASVIGVVAKYFANPKADWGSFDFAYIGLLATILFLTAISLIRGFDWAYTFMTLYTGISIVMSISNIFNNLQVRTDLIEAATKKGTVYTDTKELLSSGVYLIAIIFCVATISVLIANRKKIKDYLYQKRY